MKPALGQMSHLQRVRFLYKLILRSHKALPAELRELGNMYVREEFKRHKNCDPSYVEPFMVEWTRYVVDLNRQIRSAMKAVSEDVPASQIAFGSYLNEEDFDKFSEFQLSQLLELAEEIHGKGEANLTKK